jgi:hypothetical protein
MYLRDNVDNGNSSDNDEEEWDGRDGDHDKRRVVITLVVMPLLIVHALQQRWQSLGRQQQRWRKRDHDFGGEVEMMLIWDFIY